MARNNIKIKVLTKKDIEKLSAKKNVGDVVLSLYVGVKAHGNFVSEANSFIESEIKQVKKGKFSEKKINNKIMELADEMKRKIKFLKSPDETRSIVMFYSTGGIREVYHVPVYISSKFIIETDPYIHPLIRAMEEYPKYAVVALERDKARFFNIYLGEIEENREILKSDVPQRINAGRFEWKGMKENNIRGHIEDHLHRHLKSVAERAMDYFRRNGFSYLIIGAHKEYLERFKNLLDKKSLNLFIGSYSMRHDYDLNDIKEKSRKIIEKHEKFLESELLEDLFAKESKVKKFAAVGINAVLENFYLHNIQTLVIGKDYREPGYVCPVCHYISSYIRICPDCKVEMKKVSDLADELMEEAIAKNLKIKHLFYPNEKLDKYGIGAFLRRVS